MYDAVVAVVFTKGESSSVNCPLYEHSAVPPWTFPRRHFMGYLAPDCGVNYTVHLKLQGSEFTISFNHAAFFHSINLISSALLRLLRLASFELPPKLPCLSLAVYLCFISISFYLCLLISVSVSASLPYSGLPLNLSLPQWPTKVTHWSVIDFNDLAFAFRTINTPGVIYCLYSAILYPLLRGSPFPSPSASSFHLSPSLLVLIINQREPEPEPRHSQSNSFQPLNHSVASSTYMQHL